MKSVYGIDIGGTSVKIGRMTFDGEAQRIWEIPTRKENRGAFVMDDITEAVTADMKSASLTNTDVAGAGVGAPGAVDAYGVISRTVNIGWGKMNLEGELSARLKMQVKASNDANVAAYGEAWKGGGAGYKNILMVTLGTGIGGGIICDGRIIRGMCGAAGEIGHIHINDDEEEQCGCGNRGCFEQYASATGAVRVAKRVLEKSTEDSVLRGRDFTCKEIFDAMAEGDVVAERAVKLYGEYLGKGLAISATILNPEAIVIGGGVSKAGKILIDILKPTFDMYTFEEARDTKFEFATLGNDAGIYGAARMIIEEG